MKKSKRLPTTKGVSRSENMRRITSKNTTPELIVRRLLFRHGFRYRLHRADLPGNPDIVFVSQCKVIFVHGCFWHAHSCRVAHRPRTNEGYWSLKLQRNQERDARHLVALKTAGWDVLTIWECELRDIASVTRKLIRFLNHAAKAPPRIQARASSH
jgi:DNA mismatch endonuclease (patch repair protein)